MWSGGRTLASHECGQGLNPIHSIWRLLLYFKIFSNTVNMLLQHCCNAVCICSSMYGHYLSLCIRYFSTLLQCCLNSDTTLQSAHHHKYQMDGCLMDTMLHKCCHNTATMLCTLHTIAWDAV